MFQIDDNLLKELGVDSLKGQEREDFKEFLRNTLQERVGEKLTDGMSDEKLDEFGYFMDGDINGMKSWLAEHAPNYENDEAFKQFKANNTDLGEADILGSYGSLLWLQDTRPDYPQVVEQTMNELKAEVKSNKDAILQASSSSQK